MWVSAATLINALHIYRGIKLISDLIVRAYLLCGQSTRSGSIVFKSFHQASPYRKMDAETTVWVSEINSFAAVSVSPKTRKYTNCLRPVWKYRKSWSCSTAECRVCGEAWCATRLSRSSAGRRTWDAQLVDAGGLLISVTGKFYYGTWMCLSVEFLLIFF